jgi:TRAP-type C4-dicarboxylate transport system substrate-binding protein
MSKRSRQMALVATLLTAAFAAVIPAYAAEVELKTQTALPKNHDLAKSFQEVFVAKLNAAGKGIIRVDFLGGPEVNPPDRAAPAVQRGAIDLLHTPTAYHAGIIPQGTTLIATNLTPADYRANGAFDLLEPNWEKKLNAKIIAIGETSAQFHLYLVKKPKLKDGVIDLTGEKIRTTGAYRPLVLALHATPVQIVNAAEVYTALERGVVEGFGWPTVGLGSQGLGKLVKYRIDPPFYHLANVVLINLDKWKSLPKQAQDILLKVGAEYEKESIAYTLQAAKADADALAKQGVEIFEMPPAGAKKYLNIAYEAMWKRVGSLLSKEEVATLRAKMYKE